MSLRPFLDANVLFTAAYNPKGLAGLLFDLGKRKAISLVTSGLALEEARINLQIKKPAAVSEFESLLKTLEIVHSPAHSPVTLDLPPKDLAIFTAAVAGRATHLLTGDKKHFGPHFNQPATTRGIIIQSVREFFVVNLGL